MLSEQNQMENIAPHVIDYAIATVVGLFFTACAVLWIETGNSIAYSSILVGLPTCF